MLPQDPDDLLFREPRPLHRPSPLEDGLYPFLEEFQGLRSAGILAPQINWAGTFVVYITPKTKDSQWVDWEIEYAEKQGKRIVGVWAYGEKECDIPPALDKYANAVVGWNGDSIIDAINGDVEEWDHPDGTERSLRPIKRYSCAA